MPCFKGLAVSIHTPDGPIAEHSVQKQTRQSRITTYIPVPPARVPSGSTSGKPEQSTFAISITLLTPGLNVPYSTPKPTIEDPYPKPRTVGGLPGATGERGKYQGTVPPYVSRTPNPNETIAAYIYFDGRSKEEVATLLRKGEETWVNSRWVRLPEDTGGGIAEREFLFREVPLERWLNGLDLEGTDQAKKERIERRQRRLEKKRRKREEEKVSDDDDDDDVVERPTTTIRRNGVLRYGGEDGPVEDLQDDDGLFTSDSDSEDDPPEPEAAGQIKVALFRVLASGEIKRGEYSPSFSSADNDDMDGNGHGGASEDVDHTTSFAEPKTLDPKTISTQTVTGLDPPESPYAVFTFFYRGERQLRKMGIISPTAAQKMPQSSGRRKSSTTDFSKLGPLKSHGTRGFSGYRDTATAKRKGKDKDMDAMDSDADDEDEERLPDGDDEADDKQPDGGSAHLSPEDARRTNEVAEGVQKIKLKRQHSAEPLSEASTTRKSPHIKGEESTDAVTPKSINSVTANAGTPPNGLAPPANDAEAVASPFKRQRASLPGLNNSLFTSEAGFSPAMSLAAPVDAKQPRAFSTPELKGDAAAKQDDVIDEDL